ncbi:MAG: plasmid maintenance system killer protein [Candidatus Delongbacteria bacterium]|nr:MAG: plasmid maintenance system killer protein [Candidatus Delongbacteria bacterium]
MKVKISDKKLKKIIENEDTKKAIKVYGDKRARKIYQRYIELCNIDNFETLLNQRVGRCHPLSGKLKGKYALDLDHPYRMVIKPIFTKDMVLKEVVVTEIIEIIDYH